jgi:hypothetical protein
MMKAPSSKFQVPKKLQAPNPKFVGVHALACFWSLGIGTYLELGTWSLELTHV